MTTLHDHALELRVLATLADVSSLDVREARGAAERSQLTGDDFHNPLHVAVWGAQYGLLLEGEGADFYRAQTRLKPDERSKMPALIAESQKLGVSMLVASAITSAADDLRSMTLRRRLVRLGRELAQNAENSMDPATVLTNATAQLARITTSRGTTWRTLADVLLETKREMAAIVEGRGSPVIPTGLPEWDRLVGGLWPTLTVIGAHSGSGKSGLIARLILNLAARGLKVAVFSLEDYATWLAYRALASSSGITQFVLRNRRLTDEQAEAVHHGETELAAFADNIMIDDRGRLPSSEVVQSTRHAVLNLGAQVVIVDHYGEVVHDGSEFRDRHDLMIATGLSELRNISKTTGVPVLVAAHLKPSATYPYTVHDFANSAAFERMARVLIAWEKKDLVLRAQILKNTHGVLGPFELPFDGSSAMVTNAGPAVVPEQGVML